MDRVITTKYSVGQQVRVLLVERVVCSMCSGTKKCTIADNDGTYTFTCPKCSDGSFKTVDVIYEATITRVNIEFKEDITGQTEQHTTYNLKFGNNNVVSFVEEVHVLELENG